MSLSRPIYDRLAAIPQAGLDGKTAYTAQPPAHRIQAVRRRQGRRHARQGDRVAKADHRGPA
ncbi:MAG: hypothetical protein WDN06_11040 [Asticcacaulis sp.]